MKIDANSPTSKVSIEITEKELDNNKGSGGLEISIPEALGNPTSNTSDTIFIESYEGKLKIHVWNGNEDPQTITLKKRNKHT